MARLSKDAAERAHELFAKPDDELGRWLADLYRRTFEKAACKAAGIDELYRGANALGASEEHVLAIRIMRTLAEWQLDEALRFDKHAAEHLAIWLALRGDYARAGRAYRRTTGFAALQSHEKRERARLRMVVTKLGKQLAECEKWAPVADRIRAQETGPRMSDKKLAEITKKESGVRSSISSIRAEIKLMGLSRKDLPAKKPVKSKLTRKARRKPFNYGKLGRSTAKTS